MQKIKKLKISHRGLYNNVDIPENSILAFKNSLKNNIPIELDIHILKDNNIVVFHDDNIKRMTGIDKNLEELTYKELEKYKLLNTEEKIPLLKDVLKIVNGKVLLNIELKKTNNYKKLCEELIKILDDYNGEFLIQSFSFKIINWFNKKHKNYKKGILISKKLKNKSFIVLMLYKLLKPDFLSINKNLYQENFINKLKKKNIPIFLWTIKKSEIPKYKDVNIIFENN